NPRATPLVVPADPLSTMKNPRFASLLGVLAAALALTSTGTLSAADGKTGREIFLELTKANDEHVRGALEGGGGGRFGGGFGGGRGTGAQFMVFAAAY